ncbi:cobalt-precorrin-6A synthase [Aquimixticola soesokkakensis]|uniref:Cobalt-precorrin-5B C(1)-methyltransferase n=1 Tax=Aquimixticola soesokkakensis TaxID=1519096 RepID=A0A1Y5SJQ8_9RHOB|nr:cobalt-precorrin-5B (C(1))-methyltransferase [Aquimixticola soesokkakensis]SLN42007.1 cobalt-precorrin-6A synthase [Aquimixticola soesokkakensis]
MSSQTPDPAKPDLTAPPALRRGWTTGACATAATRAALMALWGEGFPERVRITLPRGERPEFALSYTAQGAGWAEAGIIKDAGDDPDVTHGAEIRARVCASGGGVQFRAGAGVGTVTKAGLPIGVGEPAINPVPREMMCAQVTEMAARLGQVPDVEITVSIPQGAEIALKTWNPRLGIKGGLSVLGTTGVVRPFSCAAWIASIHRGVDVARAGGQTHVAGCTGATSERVVQALHGLPDHAMLDMGDFAGGLVKYLRKHPVARLTIGGGIGKMAKLAQGALDLHSRRSQVDFARLAARVGVAGVAQANTALEAVQMAPDVADLVALDALATVRALLRDTEIALDIVVIDRAGAILARAQ